MRSRSLVLLLAMAGTALSGCASGFDSAYTQSSIPGQPVTGSTTDTGGDGISGDTNGTGETNEVTLASGGTTLAFVNGARSIDGSGKSRLNITNPDIDGEYATVSVDPGKDMGFTGTSVLPFYPAGNSKSFPSDPTDGTYVPPTFSVENATYKEYRKIDASTDSELQVWNFSGDNYAAHFRDVKKGQDAWFFGGANPTESAVIAGKTGPRHYSGNYAGVAKTTGWDGAPSSYQTANGEWRFNGTAELDVNFGTAEFSGTLAPKYWEKFENGGAVMIDVDNDKIAIGPLPAQDAATNDIQDFHQAQILLTGEVIGNKIVGEANITNTTGGTEFVNGDQAMQAGFYGSDAEQITGVFATYGVQPEPSGGATGINDDRRNTIDLQGMFHGQ